ncbi:phage baseplate assembly protein V [Pseudoalteromonas umbrosa]|uniref:phage baseplate assembly protein V n=1 Tax=Pseudoalteromonas umbrosa TaxID=3048489 RepID=UPI0024C3CA36|nr:phage baseplate assembly protein V [Pseudoalteromonas sp. B95]MDK1290216.1 phage baseplate assembly protein V [Pseudoalteromonas sp. B95]
MGLLKQADWLRPRHELREQFEAEVVKNDDPRMLGRVKCSIKGLLDITYISIDDLPWVSPQFPAEHGTLDDGSAIIVPEVGSTILVEFPSQDIYQPIYRWRKLNRKSRPKDFHSEYPERYGHQDRMGNKFIINKRDGHSSKETRSQDGSLHYHNTVNGTQLITDPHGTIIEIDRPNQRLFIKFGGLEATVSPEGVSINTPSLTINAEDALSLLSSSGMDVNSLADGHGVGSFIESIAEAIEKTGG